MDPTGKFSSNGCSQGSSVSEASRDNRGSTHPFPRSITAVGPDGKNYEIPYRADFLPTVQCKWIIKNVATDFCEIASGEDPKDIIDLKFNGASYPPETPLEEIHKKIDLNTPSCVTAKFTDVAVAKMRLKEITNKSGSWALGENREIFYESEKFDSNEGAENFIKNFKDEIGGMRIGIQGKVQKIQFRGRGGTLPPPVYVAHIRINENQAKKIIDAAAAREIIRVSPLIAQAIRNADANSLGMLPIDVLCNLGPFLAPDLPEKESPGVVKEKIVEAEDKFWKKEEFLRIEPVHAKGVRASIGATSCLLLPGSGVSRNQAENLESIVSIDFSSEGMVLRFPDKNYANRFFHALKNAEYSDISFVAEAKQDKFGKYQAAVTIMDLHQVKRFVEDACGYRTSYARDLFGVSRDKIVLTKEFFIAELTGIGKLENASSAIKKERAKVLIDNLLHYLSLNEVGSLQQSVWELSRPDAQGNLGPLQFLREHTGLASILPGKAYSDEVGTYTTILTKISELARKNS
jgi:hypothetical protein